MSILYSNVKFVLFAKTWYVVVFEEDKILQQRLQCKNILNENTTGGHFYYIVIHVANYFSVTPLTSDILQKHVKNIKKHEKCRIQHVSLKLKTVALL